MENNKPATLSMPHAFEDDPTGGADVLQLALLGLQVTSKDSCLGPDNFDAVIHLAIDLLAEVRGMQVECERFREQARAKQAA